MADWQDPKTMSTWIWGVSLIIVFLIIYFLLFIKNYVGRIINENKAATDLELRTQQDLLKHELSVQEEERSRIALDLHDNLISQLNIVRMLNENEEDRMSINKRLKESIKMAREISHDLTPPMINEMHLSELMKDYISGLAISLEINFYCYQSEGNISIKKGKVHIFRIFQELITNCLKHANASRIDIFFRCTNRITSLMVKDNGIGLNYNGKNNGIGLKNIESRVQYLNANYRFTSKKEKGTIFTLCINSNEL